MFEEDETEIMTAAEKYGYQMQRVKDADGSLIKVSKMKVVSFVKS